MTVPPASLPMASAPSPSEATDAAVQALEPRGILSRRSTISAPFLVVAMLALAFASGQWLRGTVRPLELFGAAALLGASLVAVAILGRAPKADGWRRPDLRLFVAAAIVLAGLVAACATFSRGLASPYLAALPLGAAYVGLVLPRRLSAGVTAFMTLSLVPLAVFGPPVTWLEALCIFVLVPGGRFFGVLAGAAHRRAERVARQLTRADRLTRSLSRQGFIEEVQHALHVLRLRRTPVALFLVDLDAFKEVNGARGGAGGDELLAWCGMRLAELMPAGSSVGRLGGDEFGIATAGMGRVEAEQLAIRVRDALGERHPVSVGVATSEDSTVTISDLLRVGNAALGRAKEDSSRRIHTLVAGGVRPDPADRAPEEPVLTYERLRRNGGRPRQPTANVLMGRFLSWGLIGLGAIGAVLSIAMVSTDVLEPSVWADVIRWGWLPWVVASLLAGIAARFIDPMDMWQVTPLIAVTTLLVGGGTGIIALAQGGGVLEPIVAGLAMRVLFDSSVAFRPQALLTLAGTLAFFLAMVLLGPTSATWAVPFHLVLIGSAYILGQVAQRGFIETTHQWLSVARTDVLTGLRNRLGLEEDAADALAAAAADGQRIAVVSVDIDAMRAYNDAHGHPAGDAAIQRVAQTLQSTFAAAVVTGRLGADEFMAAVPVLDASDADRLTATIEAVLRPELEVSAGVAVFPDHGRDLDGLLHVADVRRRAAKAARRERAASGGTAPAARQTPAA